MSGLCSGSNIETGGVMGGMRRGRTSICPRCGRRIGVRPGKAGRLYSHKAGPKDEERSDPQRREEEL